MRSAIINFLIIGLLFISGCSTKEKSSDNDGKSLDVRAIKLNPGDYTTIEGSDEVLWECEWLGGARHDGSVQLVSGFIFHQKYICQEKNVSGCLRPHI